MSHHLIPGKFFKHQHNLGFQGLGGRMENALGPCVVMPANITADEARIQEEESKLIKYQSTTQEGLLMDRINAIIYQAGIRKVALKPFPVSFEDCRLYGQDRGDKRHADCSHFVLTYKVYCRHQSLLVKNRTVAGSHNAL